MARLSASLCMFVVLFAVTASPVLAQAPSNDDIGSPTVIGTIPFSDGPYSAAEATTGITDPACFGDAADANTVWYEYTANADGRLAASTFGSDYDTTLYLGTPDGAGGIDLIDCVDDVFTSRIAFDATAGTTYLFMVGTCCGGGGFGGGNLVFSLQEAPPLMTIDLAVDPIVSVTKAGVATLTGTATCSQLAESGFLEGSLSQRIGRRIITSEIFFFGIDCGPGGPTFAFEVEALDGTFAPRKGSVSVFAEVCGAFDECTDARVEQQVRLRPAHRATPAHQP
jgi:hypothetical protein